MRVLKELSFDIKDVEVELVGDNDRSCNDNCDAYIERANLNGVLMTEEQLGELEQHYDLVYELIYNYNH